MIRHFPTWGVKGSVRQLATKSFKPGSNPQSIVVGFQIETRILQILQGISVFKVGDLRLKVIDDNDRGPGGQLNQNQRKEWLSRRSSLGRFVALLALA